MLNVMSRMALIGYGYISESEFCRMFYLLHSITQLSKIFFEIMIFYQMRHFDALKNLWEEKEKVLRLRPNAELCKLALDLCIYIRVTQYMRSRQLQVKQVITHRYTT